MSTLYALRLEHGKYYIGKTTRDVDTRFAEHIEGNGSAWTSLYPPIEVMETVSNIDEFDEDKYVKIYMKTYGIGNVRGGSYSGITLSDNQVSVLQQELRGAADTCFGCGQPGHYVKDCTATVQPTPINHHRSGCSRCGRDNHTVDSCYATYTVTDKYIRQEPNHRQKCSRCGRTSHTVSNCYATSTVGGDKMSDDSSDTSDSDDNLWDSAVNVYKKSRGIIKAWWR